MNSRKIKNIRCFDVFDADGKSYIKYDYFGKYTKTIRYYFERPGGCTCTDDLQCYDCTVAEIPIKNYLKKNEDDYKMEEQLFPVSTPNWIRKLEQINAYKKAIT